MASIKMSRRGFLNTAAISAAAMSVPFTLKRSAASDNNAKEDKKLHISQNWCEMCFWGCGVTAYNREGRVFKLEGQPKCPKNYGKLCARGNSGIYQLYDPDRLKKPLIRTGKRGEGKFREATYEEAISYVADKTNKAIKEYGKGTVSLIAHGSGEHAFINLMSIIGSPNTAIPAYSQCTGSREIGWFLTYGRPYTGNEPIDAANSKCLMFFGRNVLEAVMVGETQRVTEGMAKGAKLIYVDPRYSKTAAKADIWAKIKPGTDLALMLGMINYIINAKLYNIDFVDKYCSGFDELKQSVKKNTPEWAEKETNVPAETIKNICQELSNAAPSCAIGPGRRLTRYGDDTQHVRAIGILNALMGNWYTPGGFYKISKMDIVTPHICEIEHTEVKGGEKIERVDGAGSEYRLAPKNLGLENKLMKGILQGEPYPVKVMFAYGTNLFQHYPDYEECKQIIDKLDLMVTCDVYLTETALYSDVIFPESTYLERKDPIGVMTGKYPYVKYREPATAPLYNTIGAYELVEKIAKKMGYKNHFKTIDDVNKEILDQLGISIDVLKKDGVYVKPTFEGIYPQAEGKDLKFNTPSGKVELYSVFCEKLGFDPIPKYTRHKMPKDDEFRLLFGRQSYHTHARTQNNRWLLALHDFEIKAWIPAKKAARLGIMTGNKVRIVKGDKKSRELTAYVTDEIHEDAIFIPHGYGRITKFMELAYAMDGASDANLCSNGTDPISGASAFHQAFVKIEKV
ncbi:molybdopterin-containing oxidoreductase family protein [Flexistipes sp.]|uniref:molybdopterin-containing oxidoreductase family protein n=1 Tax=Flexistipes sp. TaxID=3088135 RepID=UPI002E1E57C2|nr:molybdopterin-dependent oxidoreductase [Flexistipes sp.]